MTVCLQGQWGLQSYSWLCVCLQSPIRTTWQQQVQTPLAGCTGTSTGPHAPPALPCFVLLLSSFITQSCCKPSFIRACRGFRRSCCYLENTLPTYKQEACCKECTSMSLLLATSSKFSCCSKVLSTLSSVMQKQRKLDSTGSFILANITNFAI